MGNIERYLRIEGEQPMIDDLPTSSRAADVKTALAMVDREREMREDLRRRLEGAERAKRHAEAEAHFWRRRAVGLGAVEGEWDAYANCGGQ